MIGRNYDLNIWNHFNTIGPRINNHVEGYNNKINSYIDYSHPHLYSAIKTLKDLETSTVLNYIQRKNGGLTQFPRRPQDKYIERITDLFRYDKSVKKRRLYVPKHIDLDTGKTLIQNDLNKKDIQSVSTSTVSIHKIDGQKFTFLNKYISENQKYLIDLVKELRQYNQITYFSTQDMDQSHLSVLRHWECENGVPFHTTGDGNCLYNALSIALKGDETLSKDLRLAMVFIIFEHENYFRQLSKKFNYVNRDFENLVERASTLGECT
ncbi:unnamed protein product [Brachionus calyciflorus]|uniref:OTU domain-containing protein n=1 Tax=Brachionus calyciflorus TaxID=104777 RepID=A0A813M9L7_9BILA|nr:unnamed protein product [Brachionus calyciflorus]